jgi:tetraacyldisaccharide 4'-kinase
MAGFWRTPGFWSVSPPTLAARLLGPIGAVYGAVTARRMARPGVEIGAPVICIGNFTAGGTGKTPTALHVAGRLIEMGARPGFLSRGHGGGLEGPVRVDPARHTAADVGDEPLLLARLAPTLVARDRLAGAKAAIAAGCDVVVMDDGLQNPALAKTLTIAVIDAGVGFGNGLTLPAGPLRAEVAAQAPFADAALLIGDGPTPTALVTCWGVKPLLRAHLAPDPAVAHGLKGRRVLALAGIGRPEKFLATLADCGAEVVDRHIVADHAPFAAGDLDAVAARAARAGLTVVTTEKDRARIGTSLPPTLARHLLVLPVALDPGADGDALDSLLRTALGPRFSA